jgi:tetratricopeptide (TPR) repeat protein
VGLGEYDRALSVIQEARNANPNDPRLLAQQFYCEASGGQLVQAKRTLEELESASRLDPGDGSPVEWETMILADQGLLAFRSGRADQGRELYQRAIAVAESEPTLAGIAATARLHLMREELRYSPTLEVPWQAVDELVSVFPGTQRRVFQEFVRRLPKVRL